QTIESMIEWRHQTRKGETKMTNQAKAIETMKKMIEGQLKAVARIYGGMENIPERQRRNVGGMISVKESQEMLSVAQYTGDFVVEDYHITRTDIDHQIRITVRLV